MMLQYLGVDSAPDSCDGCDVCQPDLPRPWSGSQITQAGMLDALGESGVNAAISSLIEEDIVAERTVRAKPGGSAREREWVALSLACDER